MDKRKLVLALASIVSGSLAFLGSPLFTNHFCRLNSTIANWVLAIGLALLLFGLTMFSKRINIALVFVVLAAPVSFFVTDLYLEWLHSKYFPDFLMDRDSLDWKIEMEKVAERNKKMLQKMQESQERDISDLDG